MNRSSLLLSRPAWVVTVAFAILLLSVPTASAQVRTARGGLVLPTATSPFGNTYADWAAAWWQWAFSLPVPENPLFDETGAICGNGQSGPVWFLGGVFNVSGTAVRNDCRVPSGKALFFPILNVACLNVEGSGETATQLRQCAAGIAETATDLAVEVDGVPVLAPQRFRVHTPSFGLALPDNNLEQLFGVPAPKGTCFPTPSNDCEPYLAAGDGYYVMLSPLSDGPHTIHFHGSFPGFGFTLDVLYNLTVGAV